MDSVAERIELEEEPDAREVASDDAAPAAERATPRAWWRWLRRAWPFAGPVVVAVVYLWMGIHYLPNSRHQINPDGVGYLSVAEKYLRGDFADAVNAYWSPLYSWLLVPLLAVGIEPLLATKVLGMLTAGATLVAMWWLLRRAGAQRDVCTLACLAATPLLLYAGYAVITPDLLVACALVFYLASFCHPAQSTCWPAALRLGLLGGVAYLAKAYALPFVLGHFVIVRAIELIRGGAPGTRRTLAINSAVTLAAMGLVVGAWSAILTQKFGHFTTGSTGRYNLLINAPNSPGQIMHWAGLLPPVNPTAISAWEDVTYYIDRMPQWRPLATAEDRQYLWNKIEANFWRTLELLEKQANWVRPILLVMLLIPLSRADLRPRMPGLILSLALLLYPCGYFLLHVEARFLTIMLVLLLLGGAYAIARASSRGLMSGWWRRSATMVVVGAMFISHPMELLGKPRNHGESLMRLAEELRPVLPAGAKVASDGNWGATLYLSYFMDLRYYGEGRPNQPREALLAEAEEMGVEFLLLWRGKQVWPGNERWRPEAAEVSKPFRIYRRIAPTTTPATMPAP